MKISTLLRLVMIGGLIELAAGVVCAGEAEDAITAGQAAAQRMDLDAALASFSKAIELSPNNGQAYYYRGWTYAQKSDWDAAIKDATSSLSLNANAPGVYYLRAWAYSNTKDLNRAFTDANKAVTLAPGYAAAYSLRGRIFDQMGDPDNALADFNLSVQVDPKYYYGYIARSNWQNEHGDAAAAASDLNEAVRLNPEGDEALNGLGWLMATSADASMRNGAKALQYSLKACELTHWKNAGHLDTLAAAYAEIGDFEQAVKWQQKAVELMPTGEHADELAQHLKLFQQKQPYHEAPKSKANPETGKT